MSFFTVFTVPPCVASYSYVSLPSELNKMESETMVRVAEINIDGKNFLIPRANLEMVEMDE